MEDGAGAGVVCVINKFFYENNNKNSINNTCR